MPQIKAIVFTDWPFNTLFTEQTDNLSLEDTKAAVEEKLNELYPDKWELGHHNVNVYYTYLSKDFCDYHYQDEGMPAMARIDVLRSADETILEQIKDADRKLAYHVREATFLTKELVDLQTKLAEYNKDNTQ